ncbi:DsbA family protein [Hymenobacter sp. BT186]|uniref:DsbA family protein n=1 Tax=Hymenobacter telluris TaxID=2816474 RepID=A0A939JBN1_9BACT|nr:DsbA family protein [Hymenobacter telluris]MBO0359321.1 DsbA family protein [Hymenobacter telluris]MBW3375347.1 DsbA family protein [Hymenobacter norwichensis]
MTQPTPSATDRPELLYIFDPLCGWCYGMSPVIRRVQQEFAGQLDVSVLCGGMVTGEQVGAIGEDWHHISNALQQVAQTTGVQFGAAFRALGEEGSYVQDSEPPSWAINAFRQLNQAQVASFAHAVQHAYFHDGADLNEPKTYVPLATAHGVDAAEFLRRLTLPETATATRQEFAAVARIGIQGFPTSVLRIGSQGYVLARGYQPYEVFADGIRQALEQGH